ncbi:trypsin-like cysteine/serine peptidase domain-containing protein [Piptocephalis cylindrospora]|uniref:Pro-apoptotic serine protease NMA111 n=1 Tax=Piptocephalis cylindrospora TaxID=1907219 RepID=A0A4V1IXX8_9FUNG|nr:trypsin-like cysteine/serine peptidase domain-containing protein [Piptocephalis cylindrospora]|eukprot:RKP12609.1 trypsin-like cysteine/serine peptidase domain-containing protein [Piptocephalis cylindrospora]
MGEDANGLAPTLPPPPTTTDSGQSPQKRRRTSSTLDSTHTPNWKDTIDQVVQSIVSIRFSQVASFDTEGAETSEATGFIVDADLGLILTNRHVVCSGPFLGEAIAHDHEEVVVTAVYRDPIHDFGFLRFNPAHIRYMPISAIPLRPDLAHVGLDIRVVGNDAGEKLSILAGSISRLDRNAPDYGDLTYNDFNTFYLQAASSTSGGSSGSPVIDIYGRAVALQAGGHNRAATDFFLPLDRVCRALSCIQASLSPQSVPSPLVSSFTPPETIQSVPISVPRGTIQTQWLHRPFDETRRLGLHPATEAIIRQAFPEEIGMLVAETVVPEGPGDRCGLEEGDILIRVNGECVTHFVTLESLLDENVGGSLRFEVERGGVSIGFEVTVQDLHSITPDRYVECGGARMNELSYQLARAYCVPVRGVWVAEASGTFRLDGPDAGSIISHVDHQATPTLQDFIRVMQTIPDRALIPVTYHSIADVHTTNYAVVDVDKHWSSFRLVRRDDTGGVWSFTDIPTLPPPSAKKEGEGKVVPSVRFMELDPSLGKAADLVRSLVKVTFTMPLRIDGFPKDRKVGAGLVLDAGSGIVVVGRNIVPSTLGDVSITVADSLLVRAKILHLHPTHNLAFLQYDPADLGDTPIQTAGFSEERVAPGHRVTLLALNHNHRPICLETTVTDVSCVTIPMDATPRFRAVNVEAITLDTPLAQQCSSGLLADAEGRVRGLWLSYLGERNHSTGHDNEYHLGLPITPVLTTYREFIRVPEKGQGAKAGVVRYLDVEFSPIQMVQARQMGVGPKWVKAVEEANPARHQLFMVRRLEAGGLGKKTLQELDVILSIQGGANGVVTRLSELELAGSREDGDVVEMRILRDKQEMDVRVQVAQSDGKETGRVICWAGAVLQEPHRGVRQQSKQLPSMVYVSGRAKGSPAYMYGIVPTMWIMQVNGIPTPDLDTFMGVVKGCPDHSYVRLKIQTFDQVPMVLSVKQNMHYWPVVEMQRDATDECGWRKIEG